jgi:integrase
MATAVADIYHQEKRLEKALEKKLPNFGKDQKAVKSFLDQLFIEELSPAKLNKYIFTLSVLKRMSKFDFIYACEDDIKNLVNSMEKSEKRAWTKHRYRVILKRFLHYLGKEPDWLKAGNGRSRDVLPEEIFSEDEVKRLAEAAYTNRDRAFVLSLYESGCRIGEFLPLKLKHVNFDKRGAVLRVNGKTGPRRIRIVFSVISYRNG